MNSSLSPNFERAQWGKVLMSIEESNVQDSSYGILIASEESFQVKVLKSENHEEMTLGLLDIVSISKHLLEMSLEETEMTAIEIQEGLQHVESRVRASIERHHFNGNSASRCALQFYEARQSFEIQRGVKAQACLKQHVFDVACARQVSDKEIALVRHFIQSNYQLLFDLTDYHESFFELTQENCKKEVILPLLSSVVMNIEQLNQNQVKKLKTVLFQQLAPRGTFFEMLMQTKEANQLFDALLKVVTDDELNHDPIKKQLMLDFAHSMKRYEYIFFKAEDLSQEEMREVEEFYQRAKVNFSTTIQDEFAKKSSHKYLNWLLKRSLSSTSVASGGISGQTCHHRWLQAEKIRSDACCEHRRSLARFPWAVVKEMHIALAQGEMGIEMPGRLRREIARTSGGWTHFFCPTKYLRDNVVQFLDWFNQGLLQCEEGKLNPIIFAAQSYQRCVSLHPFENGNGRISRFLMDYVLERFHLPPPVLGKDVSDGVFPMDPQKGNHAAFVKKIMKGIESSRKELFEL